MTKYTKSKKYDKRPEFETVEARLRFRIGELTSENAELDFFLSKAEEKLKEVQEELRVVQKACKAKNKKINEILTTGPFGFYKDKLSEERKRARKHRSDYLNQLAINKKLQAQVPERSKG